MGLLESDLLPKSIQKASDFLQETLHSYPELESMATQVYQEAVNWITAWIKTDMLPQLTNVMNGLLGTLTVAKNLLIGLIVAVYILNSKEKFSAQGKKLLYCCVPAHRANVILDNVRFTNQVFGGFISGKLLDSLIIGVLCFLGMLALQMPYAMLISVIIGVTNIIPFFGPFIGAIPTGLLILMISPIKALYFVIFVVVLQQFDGNILGPKILSSSTGLSSFWVMFAILVAGGLFGFAGMVLGVPVFAVLYSIIAGAVNHSLRKKGLPDTTAAYYDLQHIEPQTQTPVYTTPPENK
jgi:predicted PurR-regulated permease PerM